MPVDNRHKKTFKMNYTTENVAVWMENNLSKYNSKNNNDDDEWKANVAIGLISIFFFSLFMTGLLKMILKILEAKENVEDGLSREV